MHDSAYEIGSMFLSTYAAKPACVVVEIGALNVNGSLKNACPRNATYLGLDYVRGDGVDIIVRPGQPIPLESESADVVISSSQMEHDIEFWTTLNELFRIVKKGGVIYINTPSNGGYHPYPCDVWRFYPDAGRAFAALGRKNKYPMTLLESFTAKRMNDQWNDFVCVLFKGEWPETQEVKYLSDVFESYNVWRLRAKEMARREAMTEDQHIIENLRNEIENLGNEVVRLQAKVVKISDRRMKTRLARMAFKSKMMLKRWSYAWLKASNPAAPERQHARIQQKTF
jgi:SAM-dependent methyltransferase